MRVVLMKFLTRKLPGNVGKECLNCYLTEFYLNCRRHKGHVERELDCWCRPQEEQWLVLHKNKEITGK